MGVSEILAHIDREITQLQQARALLGSGSAVAPKKAATAPAAKKTGKKKRNLTPEGRKAHCRGCEAALGGAEEGRWEVTGCR